MEVLFKNRRVASHPRSYRKGGFTTLKEHMPKAHQKYLEWTPSRIIRWANQIGPNTEKLVTHILENKPHPQQGFRSCLGIIRLGKVYSQERLEAACAYALSIRGFFYKSVESILKNGIDQKQHSSANNRKTTPSYPTSQHPGKRILPVKGKEPMLNEQTFDKLYGLKLLGMAEGFKEQLQQPDLHDLSFEERFGLIVDRQWTFREDCRLQRLLKEAKLKINACAEDIDYKNPRGIDKSVILSLLSGEWIQKHQNVIISGPTGVGKTFLACALAQKACREGYRAFYIRIPKLLYHLALSKADGSYPKTMKKLFKTQVLVLDDFGLAPLTDPERRDLLEVIEDRHGTSSTIVTSQLPIENWHEHIGNPTIADAILDRLIHNAHRINLKGGSMRKKLKLDSA